MEHYNMEYPVTFITSKNEEELWIGTINGVYLFNKKKKQVKPVSLSSDIGNVNTIYKDGEYLTYIGTSGKGLFIYDEQTGKLENYSSANSALICNNIYSIIYSHKGICARIRE
jgi:ligand-binding sensor domain-containing protein